MIFHHWVFNHGYKSRNSVCNGCHGLTMLSFDVSNVAIIAVKNVDYRYIIHSISKFDPIDSLKIVIDCGYIYKNIALNFSLFKTAVFTFFCLVHTKWLMVWTSISILMLILEK